MKESQIEEIGVVNTLLLKKSVMKFCEKVNTKDISYVNLTHGQQLMCNSILCDTKNLCSKDFYWLLVDVKACRNYMEEVWIKRLGCENLNDKIWRKIYLTKCHTFLDKNINMFNYKILTNSLPTPLIISKLNKEMAILCESCNVSDTIMHILYGCKLVRVIWNKVSNCLNIVINLKSIIIGCNHESTNLHVLRETVISFVAYLVYTYKMKCKNKEAILSVKNFERFIAMRLLQNSMIFQEISQPLYNLLQKVANTLII